MVETEFCNFDQGSRSGVSDDAKFQALLPPGNCKKSV